MLRTKITTALVGIAALGTIAIPATANAATPHAHIFVNVFGGWVAEDQLTIDEVSALDSTCAPVQYAIEIPALTYGQMFGNVTVLAHPDGEYLVAEADATPQQISDANSADVGLNLPAWIGPSSYQTTASGGFTCA